MPENTGPPTAEEIAVMKDRNPDTLLFFRDGDTYRIYGEDAVRLWTALDCEPALSGGIVPSLSFPERDLEIMLANALAEGWRAAVVERVANHAAKDCPVEKIVTPGRVER